MRLVNCSSLDSLRLEQFEVATAPRYAILSHTWEVDPHSRVASEVTFEDIQVIPHRRTEANKAGWEKIGGACRSAQAFDHTIQFVWVDSCCIDKKNGAELAEAINSMFQWYAQSTICIAYMSGMDVEILPAIPLAQPRRFSRGWTLQELVASPKIRFYNSSWQFVGDKVSLSTQLADITGVDVDLLEATDIQSISHRLASISVCQKMSWMSKRTTTKVEDTAYCLLGIFDIHMPLLYGEREAAFIRLQEEIVSKYNDLTIFAWRARNANPESHNSKNIMFHKRPSSESDLVVTHECYHGIFACSPSEFEDSGNIASSFSHSSVYNPEFSITNKGLRIGSSLLKTESASFGDFVMPLMCCFTPGHESVLDPANLGTKGQSVGISLKWVGGSTYVRYRILQLHTIDPRSLRYLSGQNTIYLASTLRHLHYSGNDLYGSSIRLHRRISLGSASDGIHGMLTLDKVSPGSMWDDDRSLFVTFGHQSPICCASYSLEGTDGLVLMVFFGLRNDGIPWLCLAENGSSLWPVHVERRREYLRRVAIDAETLGTKSVAIHYPLSLPKLSQRRLKVKGTFVDDRGAHSECVHKLLISTSMEKPGSRDYASSSRAEPTLGRAFYAIADEREEARHLIGENKHAGARREEIKPPTHPVVVVRGIPPGVGTDVIVVPKQSGVAIEPDTTNGPLLPSIVVQPAPESSVSMASTVMASSYQYRPPTTVTDFFASKRGHSSAKANGRLDSSNDCEGDEYYAGIHAVAWAMTNLEQT